jgi:hypothetical protein
MGGMRDRSKTGYGLRNRGQTLQMIVTLFPPLIPAYQARTRGKNTIDHGRHALQQVARLDEIYLPPNNI